MSAAPCCGRAAAPWRTGATPTAATTCRPTTWCAPCAPRARTRELVGEPDPPGPQRPGQRLLAVPRRLRPHGDLRRHPHREFRARLLLHARRLPGLDAG